MQMFPTAKSCTDTFQEVVKCVSPGKESGKVGWEGFYKAVTVHSDVVESAQ